MKIKKNRIVDKSERDANGMYEYYYEYDIYEFVFDEYTLTARNYFDEPDEAHFLSKSIGNRRGFVEKVDLLDENILQAISHLKKEGKKVIKYLSHEGSGGYKTIKT